MCNQLRWRVLIIWWVLLYAVCSPPHPPGLSQDLCHMFYTWSPAPCVLSWGWMALMCCVRPPWDLNTNALQSFTGQTNRVALVGGGFHWSSSTVGQIFTTSFDVSLSFSVGVFALQQINTKEIFWCWEHSCSAVIAIIPVIIYTIMFGWPIFLWI